MSHDITHEVGLEQNRQKQEQILLQNSKMATLGEMISVISHQYKQPLNTLLLLASDTHELLSGKNGDKMALKKIENILKKYWPGELTVIFRANQNFTKHFDKNMETIGIRIPKNETALEIIKKSGGVLLTTSANISGENAVTKVEKLSEELIKNADIIISNEKVKLTGKPSTIVKYEDGKLTLLREGNIAFEEIINNFR